MKTLAGIVFALGVFATSATSTAFAATKCTSLQARCALEVGGECDPKTGRWAYGNWQGINRGGMGNRGGAFDACISRGLKRDK